VARICRAVASEAIALASCLAAALAQAAGFRLVEVPSDAEGPALTGAVWSPCSTPPGEIDIGRTAVPDVKDCPIDGDRLPLVVISHGRGGDLIGHHDTAEALADAGFIVAAISHPGDTVLDMSRSSDLSVFVERPTDIKRLIDFMLGASPVASKIDPERIGFFGFSRGGYTGLVVIGSDPDWAIPLCQRSSAAPACEQILRGGFRVQPLAHDPRIKAAVIADPFAIFFAPASFAGVNIPVQLWASERGGDGVTPESVAMVDKNIPANHEYYVVPNSGHFAFLPPCSAAPAQAPPELCTDAPGFDRAPFHKQFDADVLAFFSAKLGKR